MIDVTEQVLVSPDGSPLPVPHYASSFALADFDGDGSTDILVTGLTDFVVDGAPPTAEMRDASHLALYQNCGGRLVRALDLDAAFEDALLPGRVHATAVDVDDDARPDILLGGWGGSLQLLRSRVSPDGRAGFAPPETIVAGSSIAQTISTNVTVWDLDGDGRLDLVLGRAWGPIAPFTADFETADDVVLLQTASGSFVQAFADPSPGGELGAMWHQTLASVALPLDSGGTLLYGGVDFAEDYWFEVSSSLDVVALEVPQASWTHSQPWANSMGADYACQTPTECLLVSSDFGGPHAFRITRAAGGATVTRVTDEHFGTLVEAFHDLWSTVLVDLDRDGRDEVLLAAGTFTELQSMGPGGPAQDESLTVYAFDAEAGGYRIDSDGYGARFDGSRPGNWGTVGVLDLDGDGALEIVAAGMPRSQVWSGFPNPGPDQYAQAPRAPSLQWDSPFTVLAHQPAQGDGRGLEIRLRGPGSHVVGARVQLACPEPGCEHLEGLYKEATVNGDFLGFGREVGVFHVGLGDYGGPVDVSVVSASGQTVALHGVPNAARSVVIDLP